MFDIIEFVNEVDVVGVFVLSIIATMYLKPVWLALIEKKKMNNINKKAKKKKK